MLANGETADAHRLLGELDERLGEPLEAVREFERAFAAYLEVTACAAVGNGTDALELALRVLGLQPGDEVILPAFSFFATASVVALLGGRPVFADVDPWTLNLDPRDAAARVLPQHDFHAAPRAAGNSQKVENRAPGRERPKATGSMCWRP